eukprot:GHVN01091339.1.p1 GENE.GHVN01091339.1~~GHVN01091339.1.p1  ORF type:complete len:561 (-),score=172.61 GHVN01091339.1:1-1683(-)
MVPMPLIGASSGKVPVPPSSLPMPPSLVNLTIQGLSHHHKPQSAKSPHLPCSAHYSHSPASPHRRSIGGDLTQQQLPPFSNTPKAITPNASPVTSTHPPLYRNLKNAYLPSSRTATLSPSITKTITSSITSTTEFPNHTSTTEFPHTPSRVATLRVTSHPGQRRTIHATQSDAAQIQVRRDGIGELSHLEAVRVRAAIQQSVLLGSLSREVASVCAEWLLQRQRGGGGVRRGGSARGRASPHTTHSACRYSPHSSHSPYVSQGTAVSGMSLMSDAVTGIASQVLRGRERGMSNRPSPPVVTRGEPHTAVRDTVGTHHPHHLLPPFTAERLVEPHYKRMVRWDVRSNHDDYASSDLSECGGRRCKCQQCGAMKLLKRYRDRQEEDMGGEGIVNDTGTATASPTTPPEDFDANEVEGRTDEGGEVRRSEGSQVSQVPFFDHRHPPNITYHRTELHHDADEGADESDESDESDEEGEEGSSSGSSSITIASRNESPEEQETTSRSPAIQMITSLNFPPPLSNPQTPPSLLKGEGDRLRASLGGPFTQVKEENEVEHVKREMCE